MNNAKAIINLFAILGVVLGVSVVIGNPSDLTGNVVISDLAAQAFLPVPENIARQDPGYTRDTKDIFTYRIRYSVVDDFVDQLEDNGQRTISITEVARPIPTKSTRPVAYQTLGGESRTVTPTDTFNVYGLGFKDKSGKNFYFIITTVST